MNLYPAFFSALEQSLNASSLRQKVIASNIANADTPFYKSQSVQFEQELARAMEYGQGMAAKRTHAKHIQFSREQSNPVHPKIVNRPGMMMNHNFNNVDVDLEMAELAKNQIQYHALVDRTNSYFQKLGMVISEGR